jgi:hypothetical protein
LLVDKATSSCLFWAFWSGVSLANLYTISYLCFAESCCKKQYKATTHLEGTSTVLDCVLVSRSFAAQSLRLVGKIVSFKTTPVAGFEEDSPRTVPRSERPKIYRTNNTSHSKNI